MLGRLGRVIQLCPDGDLKVKVDDVVLKLSSKCCTLMPQSQHDMNNTFVAGGDSAVADHPSQYNFCSFS